MSKSKDYFEEELYVGELDYDEDIEPYISPKKQKKLEKVEKKQSNVKKAIVKKVAEKKEPEIISEVLVETCCNKCGHKVCGELINYIYQAHCDLNIPLVVYYCSNCSHNGRRSVQDKALKSDQFDKLYFK